MFVSIKRLCMTKDSVMNHPDIFSSLLEHPHSARVSLISLLIVVLTEVPRESVI